LQDEKAFITTLLDPETQNTAFNSLVQQYSRPLYNHIRGMVIYHDDTDDVLQNTFIKIFKNLENFKGDSKLFTWMYRIATNEALTFLSQKARKNNLQPGEVQEKAMNNLQADEYFEGDALQLKLQKAVTSLPEKQQLVFRMKYFEDMKYEDMSEILGTSVGALKASYHHAVKKIEDYINNN